MQVRSERISGQGLDSRQGPYSGPTPRLGTREVQGHVLGTRNNGRRARAHTHRSLVLGSRVFRRMTCLKRAVFAKV